MVGGRVKYLFGGGPLVPGKVGVVHGHHNALSVSPDSVVSDSLGKTGERLSTKSADALSLSLSVFLQDKLFLLELFLFVYCSHGYPWRCIRIGRVRVETAGQRQTGRVARFYPLASAATAAAASSSPASDSCSDLQTLRHPSASLMLLRDPPATPEISAHLLHGLVLFYHQVVEEVALLSVAGCVPVEL